MSPRVLVYAIAVTVGTLLLAPVGVFAAKLTCLTGTDPSVADDLPQIKVVRADVDAACPCASFDGSKGKTHAKYVTCASGVINTQVTAGNLRTQCKATVKKYYSVSTCGVLSSKGDAPCIKTSAAGKVSCSIKPSTKCPPSTPCASFTTCIDAADTNGDGLIGKGDSGACASSVIPTVTPPPPGSTPTQTFTSAPAATFTFTPTPTPCTGLCDNGDGTITDSSTGLMWEKKDQAGGLDDVNSPYVWAGDCSDSSGYCQPDAAAASTCSAATGGAVGCAQCGGAATCDTFGLTTIWDWLNQLNVAGLGGHSDWRIPTVGQDGGTAELETILASPCPGGSQPCVAPVFNNNCTPACTVTGCSCIASYPYWSATTYAADPQRVWLVGFNSDSLGTDLKDAHPGQGYHVRAVR